MDRVQVLQDVPSHALKVERLLIEFIGFRHAARPIVHGRQSLQNVAQNRGLGPQCFGQHLAGLVEKSARLHVTRQRGVEYGEVAANHGDGGIVWAEMHLPQFKRSLQPCLGLLGAPAPDQQIGVSLEMPGEDGMIVAEGGPVHIDRPFVEACCLVEAALFLHRLAETA